MTNNSAPSYIHAGHGLRNFSEEELVECIGWTKVSATARTSHCAALRAVRVVALTAECTGRTQDQYGYVAGTATEPGHGFEDMAGPLRPTGLPLLMWVAVWCVKSAMDRQATYPPYVEAGYKDANPPIPGHPCAWDKSKVIEGTDTG